MWSELATLNNDAAKERIHLCNRYCVMQAVFEGLITDWLVGIGVVCFFLY